MRGKELVDFSKQMVFSATALEKEMADELSRIVEINEGLIRALQDCRSDLLFVERVDKSANFQSSILLANYWLEKASS